ncbi:MmgE/PrpD family protein [Xylophilus ampelinus]|nr:MmgE/PrpD family protein [Variovorax sp.]VTY27342.1 MmgE/PrpD family protein [Xylophilus ampelinus]
MKAIEALAAFVSEASFGNLPKEVVEAAKYRVLDVIGSALWGVHVGTASAMRRVLEPQGGTPEATVLGRGLKLPVGAAAYLNSATSPALLDTCRFSTTHPCIVRVPAALASAEISKSTGQDFLLSVAVGYEVLIRLGLQARVADVGFVPTALLGRSPPPLHLPAQ